ncbi:MAG: hypothetical protein HYV09_17170 [Deltaproteobacteria bacterium]|nr:hypothetical protein [Deltaproteobacteria bacterium]
MRTALLAMIFAAYGCGGSGDTTSSEAPDTAPLDAPSEATAPDADADAAADTTIAPADFRAKGPATVSKVDGKVNDVAVHALVPSGPAPASGWPAVIFAHGFQLNPKQYDDILGHVASWGWVVVSTDYVASLVSNDHRKVRQAIVDAKNAALAGTITGVPKIDPARVAASGHSLGGKCATWAAIGDKGFAATFVLDPVDGGGPFDTVSTPERPFLISTGEVGKLTTPIGYVGATQSRCKKLGTACAPEGRDAKAFFDATPASVARFVWPIFDFGHMQFLDDPACGFTCDACVVGKSDAAARRDAIKALFVAFLARTVLGDASAQTWLDGERRTALVTAKLVWDGKTERPACP